jgi:CheY-like chemotaxis protein
VSMVLVVDDEPDVRLLTRLLLEMAGHQVIEAPDGEHALETLAGQEGIDVVLLDLRMPGISGWDVMARLRKEARLPGLHVVVFSAHMEPREYDRVLQEGAQGYLTKPFTEEALLAAVASTVA